MSRSGYTYDGENTELWRGAVTRSINGKRGQTFLREMLAALNDLPEQKLIANDLTMTNGDCCALGSVALARNIDVSSVDPEDSSTICRIFGISNAMACEIMYMNDEGCIDIGLLDETPENRFKRMREWVLQNLKENTDDKP